MTDHIVDANKMGPMRIQRKRTKGWRMPTNTFSVCRPGKYGNRFAVRRTKQSTNGPVFWWVENCDRQICVSEHNSKREASEHAVYLFCRYQIGQIDTRSLTGSDLACYCALCPKHTAGKPFAIQCDACEPCHADEIGIAANTPCFEDHCDDDDDDEPIDPDDEFLDLICGMMPDGQCTLAGTEECDWQCPRGI